MPLQAPLTFSSRNVHSSSYVLLELETFGNGKSHRFQKVVPILFPNFGEKLRKILKVSNWFKTSVGDFREASNSKLAIKA